MRFMSKINQKIFCMIQVRKALEQKFKILTLKYYPLYVKRCLIDLDKSKLL